MFKTDDLIIIKDKKDLLNSRLENGWTLEDCSATYIIKKCSFSNKIGIVKSISDTHYAPNGSYHKRYIIKLLDSTYQSYVWWDFELIKVNKQEISIF